MILAQTTTPSIGYQISIGPSDPADLPVAVLHIIQIAAIVPILYGILIFFVVRQSVKPISAQMVRIAVYVFELLFGVLSYIVVLISANTIHQAVGDFGVWKPGAISRGDIYFVAIATFIGLSLISWILSWWYQRRGIPAGHRTSLTIFRMTLAVIASLAVAALSNLLPK